MEKTKHFLSIILILLLSGFAGFSQGNFAFHAGPVFPLGDFADDDVVKDEDVCGAGIGVNVGVQYIYTISNGIGVFGGFDFCMNSMKKDAKDDIEKNYFNKGVDITYPKYIYFPVSAGINYIYEVNSTISVVGNVGLVLNFFKMTDLVGELNNSKYSLEPETATKVGFKIAGGVLVKERFLFEVNFFPLGEYDIDYDVDNDGNKSNGDWDKKISIFTITAGIRL